MKRLFIILFFLFPFIVCATEEEEISFDTDSDEISSDFDTKEELLEIKERQNSFFEELTHRTKVGGFGAIGYQKFLGRQNKFSASWFGLSLSHKIHTRIKFDSEIIYNAVPNYVSDDALGSQGGFNVNKLHLDLELAKLFNIRGGIILIPFGHYNLNYHDAKRELTDAPMIAKYVIPAPYSDAGASIFGEMSFLGLFDIGYTFYVVNGFNENLSTTNAGLANAKPGFLRDNNNDKSMGWRLFFNVLEFIKIGSSGYYGCFDDTTEADLIGHGVDWDTTIGKLQILGEYADFDVEDGGSLTNASGNIYPKTLRGLYVQLNYHFWFKFLNKIFLGKYFEDPTFTLVFRYDRQTISGNTVQNYEEDKYVMGLNYRPLDDFVIKFEYQLNYGDMDVGDNDGFLTSIAAMF